MIVSLARANLLHDWRRHMTAIVVLVLAGLLMTIQLGFVAGFIENFGELQRQLRADLVVEYDAGSDGFNRRRRFSGFGSGSLEPRHEGFVWMHPEVVRVEAYSDGSPSVRVTGADGSPQRLELRPLDPSPESMTFPRDFPDSLREIIATPGAIVIPRATRHSLELELGDSLAIGENEAIVGGVVNGLAPNFGNRAFASPQTVRLLSGQSVSRISRFLVQIKNPESADQVIKEMNTYFRAKKLKAMKVEDVARSLGISQIFDGPGAILLGSAAFALLVGCGIASQTLRGSFLAQIREFGALRALGVRKRHLAWIAMEQAWWTGLISVPIAALIAFGIRAVAKMFDITIALPLNLMIGSSILLMVVAIVAGLISLTVVNKAQPSELLR